MPVNDDALVQRCIEHFHQKWRDSFPGVEPARFACKPEPAPTGAISVDQWNGFITIGMAEQYADKGLSGQISNLQGDMLQSRDLFKNCIERLRGCKEEKTQEKLTMHKRRRPWRTRWCS